SRTASDRLAVLPEPRKSRSPQRISNTVHSHSSSISCVSALANESLTQKSGLPFSPFVQRCTSRHSFEWPKASTNSRLISASITGDTLRTSSEGFEGAERFSSVLFTPPASFAAVAAAGGGGGGGVWVGHKTKRGNR